MHHGNLNIDTKSPVVSSGSAWSDLIIESDEQASFETIVSGIGGAFASWYAGLSTEGKTAMREGFAVLDSL